LLLDAVRIKNQQGSIAKKGRGEEKDVGKADIGTEATTAVENTATVEVWEAPIPQVQIIPFPVNFT